MIRRAGFSLLLVCAAAAIPACDSGRPGSAASAPAESVDRSAPEPLARDFLRLVREDLDAVAARNHQRVKALRAAAAALVDRSVIEKELARSGRYDDKLDELTAAMSRTWISIASHDAPRVALESLETRPGASPQAAAVLARLPEGDVSLRIECRADAAGRWSIASVDFERRRGGIASIPVTATGSAPASP